MVEAAVVGEQAVEGFLARVAEGRMAEVVGEGDGFGEIFVEAERAGERAADGRDFHRVGEARAVVVAGAVEEDLGFVFEAAEGGRVDDARGVALEFRAPAVRRLRVEAPARGGGKLGERR